MCAFLVALNAIAFLENLLFHFNVKSQMNNLFAASANVQLEH